MNRILPAMRASTKRLAAALFGAALAFSAGYPLYADNTQSVGPSGTPSTPAVPPMPGTGVAPPTTVVELPPNLSVVLVIDVSGSMGSNNKMNDAKAAAKETLARYLTPGLGAQPAAPAPAPSATPSLTSVRPPLSEIERFNKFGSLIEALRKLQAEAGNPATWGLEDTRRMRGLVNEMDKLMEGITVAKAQEAMREMNPLVEKMHFAIATKVNEQLGGGHRYMVSGKKASHVDFGGFYSTKMSDHDAIYVGPHADEAKELHVKLGKELYGDDWLLRTDSCMESGAKTFAEATSRDVRRARFKAFEVSPQSNNDWMRTPSGSKWVNDYVVKKGEVIDLDAFRAAGDAEAAGVRRKLSEVIPELKAAGVSFDQRQLRDIGYSLGAASDFDRQFSLNVARKARAGDGPAARVLQMDKYLPRFEEALAVTGTAPPAELARFKEELKAAKKLAEYGQTPPNLAQLDEGFASFRSLVRKQAAAHEVVQYNELMGKARLAGDTAEGRRLVAQAEELLDDIQGALHNYDQLSRSGAGALRAETRAALRTVQGGQAVDDLVWASFKKTPFVVGEANVAEAVAMEPVRGLNPFARPAGSGGRLVRSIDALGNHIAANPGSSLAYVAGLGYVSHEIYDAYIRGDRREAGRLLAETGSTEAAGWWVNWMVSGETTAASGMAGFAASMTAAVAFNAGYYASSSYLEYRNQRVANAWLSGHQSDQAPVPNRSGGILDSLGVPVDEGKLLDAIPTGLQPDGDTRITVDRDKGIVTINRNTSMWATSSDPNAAEGGVAEVITLGELKKNYQLQHAFQTMRGKYLNEVRANNISESGQVATEYVYDTGAQGTLSGPLTVRIANPGGVLTQTEFDFYRKQFDQAFGNYTLNFGNPGSPYSYEEVFHGKAQAFKQFMESVVQGKQRDMQFAQRLGQMTSAELEGFKALVDGGQKVYLDGAELSSGDLQARIDRARSGEDGALAAALRDFRASNVSDETHKQVDVLIGLDQLSTVATPGGVEFGILAYSGNCKDKHWFHPFGRVYDPLAKAVDSLSPRGGTPMTPALYQARHALWTESKADRGVIILLTDGQNDCSASPVKAAESIFQRTMGDLAPLPAPGTRSVPASPTSRLWPSWFINSAYADTPPRPPRFPGFHQIDTATAIPPARMNMPITVSTVGFQVRPQQQQALDQIAAAGGGRSAGAANMAELASAFHTAVQTAAPVAAPPPAPAPVARAPMSSGGGGGMLVRRSRWSGPAPWVIGTLVVALLATVGYAVMRRFGPLPAFARAAGRPSRMRVRHADGREEVIVLDRLPLSIGRRKGNDLVLDDAGVSREHARIVDHAGQVQVEDLGSAGGTYLGRRRVSSAALGAGSVLVLGGTHISFEA